MMKSRQKHAGISWMGAVVLAASSCTGNLGPGDEPEGEAGGAARAGGTGGATDTKPSAGAPGGPQACGTSSTGPVADVPARLLTAPELEHALATLLPGVSVGPLSRDLDSRVEGFLLNTRETISDQHLQALRVLAERVAESASRDPGKLHACPADGNQRACSERFVLELAARAFRRPLEPAQADKLRALHGAGFTTAGASGGLQFALEALLQAPSFLYVHEDAHGATEVVALGEHELAQRLAAGLLRGLPDEPLRADAAAGRLSDPAVRAEHARRLLNTPRGKAMLRELFMQGHGLDTLASQAFAASPDGAALAAAMIAEDRRFIDHVLQQQGGVWSELFDAPYTFVDETLAEHHGIDLAGADEVEPGVFKVNPPDRVGLALHASMLTLKHGPVHRGLALRKAVLCGDVPGPVGVDIEAIPTQPGESERSKAEKRLAAPGCGACHAMMDPLGLTFEPYDELGRIRSQDRHGNPVSGQGEITATAAHDGKIESARALMERLATSAEARRCVVRKLFVWNFGRVPDDRDEARLARLDAALAAGGDRLEDALVALVRDPGYAQACGQEETP